MEQEYICSDCLREISVTEVEEQSDIFCRECGGKIEKNIEGIDIDNTDIYHEPKKQKHLVTNGVCQSGLASHGKQLYKARLLLIKEDRKTQYLGYVTKITEKWAVLDASDVIVCDLCAQKAFSEVRKKSTLLVFLMVAIFIGSFSLLALLRQHAANVDGMEIIMPVLLTIGFLVPIVLGVTFKTLISDGLSLLNIGSPDMLTAESVEIASKYYFNLRHKPDKPGDCNWMTIDEYEAIGK